MTTAAVGAGLLLWAKQPERLLDGEWPYPVSAHLLDTAVVAGALWDIHLTKRIRRLLARALADGDAGEQLTLARQWVMLAAGLHDLGKIQDVFQLQSTLKQRPAWRAAQDNRLRDSGFPAMDPDFANHPVLKHANLGMALLTPARSRRWPAQVSCPDAWLALVVGGHHGWWQPLDSGSSEPIAQARAGCWGEAQQEHIALVSRACGVHPDDAPCLSNAQAGVVTVLLTGIVQLADWLASAPEVINAGLRLIDSGADPASAAWATAREDELAPHVRSTLGVYTPPSDRRRAALGVNGSGACRDPRPLQADAEKVGDGLWFVAYPTSEGKTGAALLRHQVEDDEGLIFALPTRVTTNAMHTRLESAFAGSGNEVRLSHQYAALHRCPATDGHGFDWYTTSTRRLLAPVLAATCDQVLAGALPQRHLPLRLLALANHHVVLDEVHTYDRYQTTLLASLMAWWGATGTRVTLLSATMPAWQRRILTTAYLSQEDGDQDGTYPAHWLAGTERPKTPPLQNDVPDLHLPVVRSDEPTGTHSRWALDSHARYPRCSLTVIRSRVDDAIDTGRRLRDGLEGQDIDVRVLHSRMTLRHRAHVEAEIQQRLGPDAPPGLRPLALVGTQVLDVSLDISTWMMSSDIAPAASLIQRAGRLWRFQHLMHESLATGASRPEERIIHLVVSTEHGDISRGVALPYFADELRRVEAHLLDAPVLRIPEDVQHFVDATTYDLASAPLTPQTQPEMIAASMHIDRADPLAKELRAVARPKRATVHQRLADLTGALVIIDDLELTTRYTDLPSKTYLLVGGARGTEATVDELQALTGHGGARAALQSLLTVSGGDLIGRLDQAAGSTATSWNPTHALLTHARPVSVEHLTAVGLVYDDELGLTRLTDKEPA